MNKPIVIFNFDGVVVDSTQLSFTLNKQMMPDLTYQEWQSWFEGNVYRSMRIEYQNDVSQDAFFVLFNERLHHLPPVDGIPEVIAQLEREYTLHIVSSGMETAIEAYLNKHNLGDHFTDILGRETHTRKVDKFHLVLKKHNIDPHETLIVTDTIGDIKEAHEVGVRSLGVTWGAHSREQLEQAKPHGIVSKPSEIIEGIQSVLGL
jgi:phosphoglycolate phosphatase